jgi:predicted GIY-YIG superfamily endonuclease
MSWCVYILRCGDGSLYTGITNDLEKRMQAHADGTGARYTRGRAPFTLVYREDCPDRSRASRREAEIRRLSRTEKLGLAVPARP